MRFSCLMTAFVAILAAAPTFSQDRVTVASGSSVAIGQHVGWTSKCSARKTIIKVTAAPASGKLKISNAKIPVPEIAAVGQKKSACTGRKLRGKLLTFTAGNAPGKQSISYEVRYDGVTGVQKRTVVVQVK